MPGQGYPDYTRLSRSGGYLLYGIAGAPPRFTNLFRGYVGAFPYLTLVTSTDVSADFARIQMNWSPDSSFGSVVGFRYVIRGGSNLAITQYANVTDWLDIFYDTKSGNQFPFTEFSLYGSQAPATQSQLASLDVAIVSTNQPVAANGIATLNPLHIQPGNAQILVSPGNTTWFVNIFNYDYTSGAYILDGQLHSSWAGAGGSFSVPMLDAPYKIDLHAGANASGNYNFSWKSV